MSEKPIYAPNYYQKFKCIKGKCRHSCCIDWEIYIDEVTLEKYKTLNRNIINTITVDENGAHFDLCKNGRCPHLNSHGLCEIICNYGEEYLSDICRLHPRFFNDLGNRIEAGLGLVCEEACRIILENNSPFSIVLIENGKSDITENVFMISEREEILSTLNKEDTFLYKTTLLKEKFCIKTDIYTKVEWIDFLLELEILDSNWKTLLVGIKNNKSQKYKSEYDKYFSRLLTYFVYRHVSTADNYNSLRAKLAFSVFSTEIIKYIFEHEEEQTSEKLFEIARMYSSEIEYSEDNTSAIVFEFECWI